MPKRQAEAAPAQAEPASPAGRPVDGPEPVEALSAENARLESLTSDAEGRIAALQRDLQATRAELAEARDEVARLGQQLTPAQAEPVEAGHPEPATAAHPEPASPAGRPVEGPEPAEQREPPAPEPTLARLGDFRSLSAVDKIKLGLPTRTPIKQRRGV